MKNKYSATVLVLLMTLGWILIMLFALYMQHVTMTGVLYLRYKALIKGYNAEKSPSLLDSEIIRNQTYVSSMKIDLHVLHSMSTKRHWWIVKLKKEKENPYFKVSFECSLSLTSLLPKTTISVSLAQIMPGVGTTYCTKRSAWY